MPINLRRASLPAFFLFCVCWLAFAANAPPAPAPAPSAPAPTHNAYVMISGGATHMANNYSQYLQARALTAYFDSHYPDDPHWVFFGAGNVEGQTPAFSDVRRQVRQDDLIIDTWVAGSLRENRPAKRATLLKALREEILPAVSGGGTLYLFVGDHGQLSGDDEESESVINLWTLEPTTQSASGWRSNDEEAIGVAELRKVLAEGLGAGRAVFVMTQCHSGGFHHMAVPRHMAADPAWFRKAPGGTVIEANESFPRVAGFTATDEDSLAAGCDPSPDPDSWSGYERYLPEKLVGLDLFTLKRSSAPMASFAAAHEAATLIDTTIDKPMATSEQYLLAWADLIDSELAESSRNLTDAMRQRVAGYLKAVETGKVDVQGGAMLSERQAQFTGYLQRMTEQNPDVKTLLFTGTRSELEKAAGVTKRGRRQPPHEHYHHDRSDDHQRKLWKGTVRPAWKAAVLAGEVKGIPAAALPFEKYLLAAEDDGREFMVTDNEDALAVQVFWRSGYNHPATVNIEVARANALWAAQRADVIMDWAQSQDKAVREAADKLEHFGPPEYGEEDMEERTLSRTTAAQRALFYRRVLAAWAFLLAANDRPALQRLQEIIELERTPLPAMD